MTKLDCEYIDIDLIRNIYLKELERRCGIDNYQDICKIEDCNFDDGQEFTEEEFKKGYPQISYSFRADLKGHQKNINDFENKEETFRFFCNLSNHCKLKLKPKEKDKKNLKELALKLFKSLFVNLFPDMSKKDIKADIPENYEFVKIENDRKVIFTPYFNYMFEGYYKDCCQIDEEPKVIIEEDE